jgi:hypothetical protein
MTHESFIWTARKPLRHGAARLRRVPEGTYIVYQVRYGEQIIYIGKGQPSRLITLVKDMLSPDPDSTMHSAAWRYYNEGYDAMFPLGNAGCQHLTTTSKRDAELIEDKLIDEYIRRNHGHFPALNRSRGKGPDIGHELRRLKTMRIYPPITIRRVLRLRRLKKT